MTAPQNEQADEFEEFSSPTDGPRCNWYDGCDQPASEEGLCAFHFDACERHEHAARQREHETLQRRAAEEAAA